MLKTVKPTTPVKWSPFGSTNFTLQSLLPLILAVGAVVGFPEDVTREMVTFIEASVFAIIGFWGPIREFFKDGIKLRYSGNVLTYIFAFLGGFVEWLGAYDIEGALGQFIDAAQTGSFNLIFPALFAIGNIVYRLTQDKPWVIEDDPEDPAPLKPA